MLFGLQVAIASADFGILHLKHHCQAEAQHPEESFGKREMVAQIWLFRGEDTFSPNSQRSSWGNNLIKSGFGAILDSRRNANTHTSTPKTGSTRQLALSEKGPQPEPRLRPDFAEKVQPVLSPLSNCCLRLGSPNPQYPYSHHKSTLNRT